MVMMKETEEALGLSFVWLPFGLWDEASIVLNQPSEVSHFLSPHYTVPVSYAYNYGDCGFWLWEEG